MKNDFSQIWDSFSADLAARNKRLCSEFEASWRDLERLLFGLAENYTIENWQIPPRSSLSSLVSLTEEIGSRLLFEPLAAYRKAKPQERVLTAIEDYKSGIEDLLRILPQTISVSGSELAGHLAAKARPFRRIVAGWRKKQKPFHLRAVVREALLEESLHRAANDGLYLMLAARVALALLLPWQSLRCEVLRGLSNRHPDPAALPRDREHWLKMVESLKLQATGVLAACAAWNDYSAIRLAGAVLRGGPNLPDHQAALLQGRWHQYFGYWSRQQRATVAFLELEFSAGCLFKDAVTISSNTLVALDEEHLQLLSELDKVAAWLQERQEGRTDAPFPPPEAKLLSAEDRVTDWIGRIVDAGRACLPVHVEATEPRRALPGSRLPWRQLEAEESFIKSLAKTGRPIALAGFREAEEGHRAIVREIERAREVAAFSMEAAQSGDEEGSQIARDGIENALSLVTYQKKTAVEYHPIVEQRLVEALASSFSEFHVTMEEGRFGILAHLARQKGGLALRTAGAMALTKVKQGTRWLWRGAGGLYNALLLKIGWSVPAITAAQPVVRHEYLDEALRLEAGLRELPPIYRRLFRLAPVEDQRFLVGRESEMTALIRARELWESGHAAALIVTGARGSGKTSLLNCASTGVFSDLPTFSGQFSNRITSADGIRTFLSSLFERGEEELETFLNSGRRLVLLEEIERTFLRRIGGFEGLHALIQWISRTSGSTLWLLSLNETAFHYLDRILGLGQHFSHRINAMAVAPEHLQSAILLRHNLSGLRLQFAPPPDVDSRIGRARRWIGLEKDAEQLFFESLYRHSQGVFRSAFELWQQSVDRVEGGVLYMLPPVEPDYEGIISGFTLEDSFILQAILQHGSLTIEELALIFDYPLEKAQTALEKLAARQVLEPDPRCPGLRVRPEAGRMVREALYRQNLL